MALSVLVAFACGLLFLLMPWALISLAGFLLVAGTVTILARRASLDLPTAGLLLFISVMTAFGRDFAYVHLPVGELPLYVTEICLALFLPVMIWRMLQGRAGILEAPRHALLFLGTYVTLGLTRLPIDLARHGLEALRDSVLVYYALFALLAITLVRTWRALLCAFQLVWASSLVATFLISLNAATGQGAETSTAGVARYGAGIQALSVVFAVLGGLSFLLTGRLRRGRWTVSVLLLAQLLVAVFLVQHRSLLLALAAGILALLLVHPERRRVWSLGLGAYVMVAASILMVLSGLVRVPEARFLRTTMERAATSVDPMADTNTHWRMTINLSLLKSVQDQPLLGAGFGEPISFRYGIVEYENVDPHNSFVAILYRLGVPAALALFLGVILMIRRVVGAIRQGSRGAGTILSVCLASFTALVVFACFNVVLEGPYMGIFFWLLLGILMRFSSPAMPDPREP